MNQISELLNWISTGLLVPTIVLLILLFLRSLALLGGCFGQWQQARRWQVWGKAHLDTLTPSTLPTLAQQLPKQGPLVLSYLQDLLSHIDSSAHSERILAQYEAAADGQLDTPRTLAKMGPILGLMGTLIPMGPALAGLASGDIASMAYNMQVAFATTVVGLVVGAIGSLTMQVQRRWNTQALSQLEFVASLHHDTTTKP
ncbi:MAG: MotA/TolQ/ExbB proton channel family protein [Bacteroidales bacterium]|nr:MotA/TolQ/ExbB proton channel family protein [Bacteroidales bacterium]